MSDFRSDQRHHSAFALRELVVVLVVVVVLAGVAAAFTVRVQRARPLAQCGFNLGQLGKATAAYARDNEESLPFAFIKFSAKESSAWDGLIFPYVDRGPGGVLSSSSLESNVFVCPLDNIAGAWRRTYAMSEHDMSQQNWPPGPSNTTGVGLWWSDTATNAPAALRNALAAIDRLPAVRQEMIPQPAGTLLYTEQARSDNTRFSHSRATISPGTAQFFDWNSTRLNPYHHGRFNYLMVDGHVEALPPDRKPGMWTIAPGD